MVGRDRQPISGLVPPARTELAQALRDLDPKAPMRHIASECGTSVASVSRTLAGQTLPDRQMVEGITRACGGDWNHIERLWHAAVAETNRGGVAGYLALRIDSLEERLEQLTRQVAELQHQLTRKGASL